MTREHAATLYLTNADCDLCAVYLSHGLYTDDWRDPPPCWRKHAYGLQQSNPRPHAKGNPPA